MSAWLLRCSKSLDFVCDNETRCGTIKKNSLWFLKNRKWLYFCFSHTPLSVVQALSGPAILKVCDPYGYLQEPPLCSKYCSTQSHWVFEMTFGSFSKKTKIISECAMYNFEKEKRPNLWSKWKCFSVGKTDELQEKSKYKTTLIN